MGCLPILCPPSGPDLPFGSPLLILFDSIRILIGVLGLYVISKSITASFRVRNPHQRAIYIALAVVSLAVLGTEVEHLGDYAHYRLFVHLAFMLLATFGLRRIQDRVRDWDDTRRHGR